MSQTAVDWKNISKFLDSLPADLQKRLIKKTDPARVVSVKKFADFLSTSGEAFSRVAVVSGGEKELELAFLDASSVDFFSYDGSETWDLTADWSDGRLGGLEASYDLVLCEQVFEHLPELSTAVGNLYRLTRPGGIVHISTPGTNGIHGEPHFYSGFNPVTLRYFFEKSDFITVTAAGWGTAKSVKMYSVCDWTPLKWSAFPNSLASTEFSISDFWRGLKHWAVYNFAPILDHREFKHNAIVWGIFRRPQS